MEKEYTVLPAQIAPAPEWLEMEPAWFVWTVVPPPAAVKQRA